MGPLSDVRTSHFRPREATQRQLDERVSGVPERCNSIVPCEQCCEQAKPSSSLEPILVLADIVSDSETHKSDRKEGKEAEECDR